MVTFNGVMRSYGAAVRRAERDQQRRAREATKRFNEQRKQQDIADNRQAVMDWNNYVSMIQSFHKNCTEGVNWAKIKNDPKPDKPGLSNRHELAADHALRNYTPSFFDKLFGSTTRKILVLEQRLEEARSKDQKEYDLARKQFKQQLNDWSKLQLIVQGLERNDPEAYKDALEHFDPFGDLGELGGDISITFAQDHVDVDLDIHGASIIPSYELRQTSTGKLSKKDMPKTRFNELYQDHVCSCVLRVARETFAYLPLKKVRVNAISDILNSATGHIESKPVLSVIIVPSTLKSLNLNTIDPSNSMSNFVHNMNFNKSTGFKEVSRVHLSS